MASSARATADHGVDLPSVTAAVNYSKDIPRAYSSVANPSTNNRPLETHEVAIQDARPIRDRLDLDVEGFRLVDHKSSVSHLRNAADLQATYHDEVGAFIKQMSGADIVLPYRAYCQVRLSQRAPGEKGNDTTRPAGFIHADVTLKTFLNWSKWVQEEEGVSVPDWNRCVLYNTWRAVSPPPQDFPLALTDARSLKTGKYVVMDNDVGLEDPDRAIETRLGLYDPDDRWYYFSNMHADELLIFKGYDSKFEDAQTVMHTGFNNTGKHPDASPRESIEARFFAFWL